MNNTYKNQRDERKTDEWLAANGVSNQAMHIGTSEVFQAQKLATNTLRSHSKLLETEQIAVLNDFLRKACSKKKRVKITQANCFVVMNIAKQIQRRHAQQLKRIRRRLLRK